MFASASCSEPISQGWYVLGSGARPVGSPFETGQDEQPLQAELLRHARSCLPLEPLGFFGLGSVRLLNGRPAHWAPLLSLAIPGGSLRL